MVSNDLTIYSRYANEWWTAGAPRFRSLQNLTPFRVKLIEELVGPVADLKVADLGCGGGLIAAPLASKGARVFGLDLSQESVAVANRATGDAAVFANGDVCAVPFADSSMDIVLMADLLDHVPCFVRALREGARILKPGGAMFVGTINRTWLSGILCITLCENLRLIPPGTHQYSLFIRPTELEDGAEQCGLRLKMIQGEAPCVFSTIAKWSISLKKSKSLAVAYSALFQKA